MEAKEAEEATVEHLIAADSEHGGAGAVLIRNAVPRAVVEALNEKRLSLPLDKRRPTAHRRFFRDEDGSVGELILQALRRFGVATNEDSLMPWFRFIEYSEGGAMAPHTDGSNRHPDTGAKSTATVLLYLATCRDGGGTALLQKTAVDAPALATVLPEQGAILVFPHVCPHEGMLVGKDPKLALRAELIQASKQPPAKGTPSKGKASKGKASKGKANKGKASKVGKSKARSP